MAGPGWGRGDGLRMVISSSVWSGMAVLWGLHRVPRGGELGQGRLLLLEA